MSELKIKDYENTILFKSREGAPALSLHCCPHITGVDRGVGCKCRTAFYAGIRHTGTRDDRSSYGRLFES